MQEGYAYPDFTTAEELDAIRAKQEAAKVDIDIMESMQLEEI